MPRKPRRSDQTPEPVGDQELIAAINRLAELLAQKHSMLELLETCAKEQTNPTLSGALMGMRVAIRAGVSMADAMAHYSDIFPADLVEAVRAGESSDDVADRLRQWSERDEVPRVSTHLIEEFKRSVADLVIRNKFPVEALFLATYTISDPQFAKILKHVRETVNGGDRDGTPIADALELYPQLFETAYINLWRQIEAGKIDAVEALNSQASSYNQELLTLDQAVQFLGSSKPTIYRLLARGDLKGLKVGRQWRFSRASLIAYMERKPSAVAVSAEADIDVELAFFTTEAEKLGIQIRPMEENANGDDKIIKVVSYLLCMALKTEASDIHIEPMRGGGQIRFRHDGVLRIVRLLPGTLLQPIISRLKVMADLDITERRLPQDGRIHIQFEERDFDLRVAVCPTSYGESVVFRILSPQSVVIPLANMGLAADHSARLEALMNRPNGLIAFTGPWGSGKTTVLYRFLGLKADEAIKIITIEDPIEYMLPFASQTAVNAKVGLTYPFAIRTMLRQDPDVLMIGEIGDLEVANLSVHAALTGHMVVTAMYTNDAASFLTRMIEMGVEPFLISTAVSGVVSQRLVRKNCPLCSEEYKPHRELLLRFGHNPARHPEATFKRGKGCDRCRQTGYKGRFAIFEILEMNDELAGLVLGRASHAELVAAARAGGMRTLAEDGFLRCLEGLTTVEETMRVLYGNI